MSAAAQERRLAQRPIRVRFGNFEADFRSRELRKHGLKVKLQQLPFEVLRILLESPGTVVSREELQRRLWPDDVVVDFDHGLNTAVRKLRDVLSDSAAAPRYIATVDRQGYRFVAPVTELEPASEAEVALVEPAPVPVAPPRSPRGIMWAVAVPAVLLILGTVALYFGWYRLRPRPVAADGHRTVLAVLPFVNLTGDANQDYFTDGLTAEMIIQAGHLDPAHLGVISRSSVMQYKKSQEQLERIAGELGMDYVLEGTVRRDQSHVRVTAELIHVSDRASLWGREYDREVDGELTVQREIAQQIADEIHVTLSARNATEPARHTAAAPASETYDLYLKGRYFWNKRDMAGFQHAVEYFEQTIAKDPNYARAYAGLADSYLLMTTYNLVSTQEYVPKAREAALRALEIDPNLAEAHTSLALLKETYDWDWPGAEKEFRRAVALDPNYATAHQWYAEFLGFEGRFDEALAESDRAMQLDPLSLIIATDRGANLNFAGQYDLAIKQLRTVFEMQPNFPRARYLLIMCYVQKGMFSQALAEIEKARSPGGGDAGTISLQVFVYGRMGRLKEARQAMQRYKTAPPRGPVDIPTWAWMYGSVGDRDQAMAQLEKAYAAHLTWLVSLKADHVWDPLRSDPRFQDLMRRVGLPQ